MNLLGNHVCDREQINPKVKLVHLMVSEILAFKAHSVVTGEKQWLIAGEARSPWIPVPIFVSVVVLLTLTEDGIYPITVFSSCPAMQIYDGYHRWLSAFIYNDVGFAMLSNPPAHNFLLLSERLEWITQSLSTNCFDHGIPESVVSVWSFDEWSVVSLLRGASEEMDWR